MTGIRRIFLLPWISGFCAALFFGGKVSAAESRPNVLLIVADDLGWGDVGWHGAKIRTPVLDRLAAEGVELTQHYVNPQCTPTRSALLSGRYASRFDNLIAFDTVNAFPAGTVTLPKVLQAAGYATAMMGKWHLGLAEGGRPWEAQGFDYSYGTLSGAAHPWSHTYRKGPNERTWHRNGKRLDEVGTHITDLIAKEAMTWLGQQTQDRPWFLYLPFLAPHTPVDAPKEWKAKYADVRFFDDENRNESAVRYAAVISQLDDAIGKVLAVVKEKGWDERTMVVFLSDNGPVGGPWKEGSTYGQPALPSTWLGSAGGLRGTKGSTWEGGVRVPALAYWPGTLAPRHVDAPVCVTDWFPTLARLTNSQPKTDAKWDGQDIWPQLTGKVPEPAERLIYCKYAGGMSFLRRGDWKLVTLGDSEFSRSLMPGANRDDQLFNIADDPNETHDLAATHPDLLAELQQLLIDEMRKDDCGRVHRSTHFQWSRVP